MGEVFWLIPSTDELLRDWRGFKALHLGVGNILSEDKNAKTFTKVDNYLNILWACIKGYVRVTATLYKGYMQKCKILSSISWTHAEFLSYMKNFKFDWKLSKTNISFKLSTTAYWFHMTYYLHQLQSHSISKLKIPLKLPPANIPENMQIAHSSMNLQRIQFPLHFCSYRSCMFTCCRISYYKFSWEYRKFHNFSLSRRGGSESMHMENVSLVNEGLT